jgi:hypothetical protein
MTALSAFRRAGGDRPHRRPGSTGWSAARAALLAVLGLLLAGSLSGQALAAPKVPTSPVIIGPGAPVPPPAPALPGGGKAGKPHRSAGEADQRAGARGGQKDQAGALAFEGSCAPFSHTQTYAGWGPAVAYGTPVTVVYEASRCSTPDGSSLDISAQGTARIISGVTIEGELLDTRPFLVTGTWRRPENADAWPLTWWTCSVPFASYTWQIPGVYSFRVSARDGLWSLDVSSQGVGSQDVSWTHDGCA